MSPFLRICADFEAMSRQAADHLGKALTAQPDLLLCAAGGTTPLRSYQLFSEHAKRTPEAARSLRVVKLDEWGGLPADDPGTCEAQVQTHLIRPLGITSDRYIGFAGPAPNPEAECERVAKLLAATGPIGLCVLGLGRNGHIAMNEPAPALQPFAHVARLAESSLHHPMLSGSRRPPTHGLTLGMAEILASREILLLVSGAAKREPLRRLLQPELTPGFPASFLWLHPNWTLLCDREAAAGLDSQP